MKKSRMLKHLTIFAMIMAISLTTIVVSPIETFAKEEYRLELFSQIADKITSLYYKEAIVGLDILDDIYSDPMLLENIEKGLNEDLETKTYLLERGFDSRKIAEILEFINKTFPSLEEIAGDDQSNNVIEKIVKTTLIEGDGRLSYLEYDEDIKRFGRDFYEVMPFGVKDDFSIYFESEQEKRDAMIKIAVEFIYSGHGKGIYNENTGSYVDLQLMTNHEFIKNVNAEFGKEVLNANSIKAIDIFLKALEETIKAKDLDRVYSDLSSVLNLVETNYEKEERENKIEKDFEQTETSNTVKKVDEKSLNRAETLKLVLKAIEIDLEEYQGEFKDVDKDNFYADYIATGKSIELINGYIDNTFRPEEKVTRSETMSILSNTAEHICGQTDIGDSEIDSLLKNFEYENEIDGWAREKTAKLVKLKVIDEEYSEKFGADQAVTRDEVIGMIDNIECLKTNN